MTHDGHNYGASGDRGAITKEYCGIVGKVPEHVESDLYGNRAVRHSSECIGIDARVLPSQAVSTTLSLKVLGVGWEPL